MLLYVNNFWHGFIEKTDPINITFFIKLFISVFNKNILITSNVNDADILLECIFTTNTLINYKHWKYSFLFTGESYLSKNNLHLFSCILGFKETSENYVKCPLFIPYINCNSYYYYPVSQIPNNSICSVISHPLGLIRNKFLDKLEKRITINHGGKFRNNIGNNISGGYDSDNLLNFYKNHKFVICMENSQESYYITEKIINGFRAGIVPIYWGSPNVTKYFNHNRFLQLKSDSDSDIDEIINKILNMTDNEYLSMINEPIFIKNNDELLSELISDIKSCLHLS